MDSSEIILRGCDLRHDCTESRTALIPRVPARPDGYWYEIITGVGLRVIVWAGLSIGVSSS